MTKRPAPAAPAADTPPDDAALFRDAIGPVRPLRTRDAGDSRPSAPAPVPRQHLADEARVVTELLTGPIDAATLEVGEELLFLRDGHDPRLLRRLRRGQFAVQDEIDLHQLNQAAAGALVRDFLAEAVRTGRRCVRIVHGKGLRSRQGPVLKTLVDRLLRRHADVLAFASARANDGGTGAVLVLLLQR